MLRMYHHFVVIYVLLELTPVCAVQPATAEASPKPEISQGGILYGSNFAYTIKAPGGWIMDDEAGQAQGLSVVFYRRGQTWEKGAAVMYVNVVGRAKGLEARDVIARDIATFKKRQPGIKVTPAETLHTADRRSAPTYIFSAKSKIASDERVAYVETPTVILIITLTAQTTKDYKSAVVAHTALISSVAYLARK